MNRSLKKVAMASFIAAIALVGCNSENADTASKTIDNATSSAKNVASNAANAAGDAAKNTIEKVEENLGPKTSIAFNNMEHDFGQIDQNTENEHIFKFTNTGTEPLIISKAKGSCGCTVPEYPKEPIAPGEDGEIKVVYKPGKQKNKQTKRVTVTANTEPAQTVLKITAEVQEVEGAS